MQVIGSLIAVVIALILLGVLWWAAEQLLPLIPLPEPFRRIIHVLLVVILVLIILWVLLSILSAVGVPVPFFHSSARLGIYAALGAARAA